VSLRHAGSAVLGTKTELKNMNSFRFLERGIEAELKRQEVILREGGEVEQETLHFDPQSGALSSLRSKEEAHDYRYFPEPDLVPVAPTEEMLSRAREALPELPAARAERFESDLGLTADTAKLLAFRSELGDLYEEALSTDGVDPKTLANWITQEPEAAGVQPGALAKLVSMVSEKAVSAGAARQVLGVLASEGGDPAEIVEKQGLGAQAADELGDIVDRAIAENADAVEKIKAGKAQAIGAIVGAVMRETKGRADGGEVQKLIREKLGF
jgi:aspartyl-tRNA(Asn)/glutamyl-tRNA(Gln) amidotransferase subunit B